MHLRSAARLSATMTEERKVFFRRLHALSVVCRFDFDEDGEVPAAYERALSSLGYDRVNAALQKIFEDRRSNEPFPSVSEIKAVMQESVSPEDMGPLVAGMILEAVAKIGPYQTEKFRHHVGEIGWRVVQMSGGLEPVCSIQDRDTAAHRAHWSRLATSLARTGLAALPHQESPQLEAPKEGEKEMKSLAHILSSVREKKP